jgi:putative transposase
MANTYSQIYIHVVFAVRMRERLLHKEWRKDLFSYMGGIISRKNHHHIIINGVEDHVHLLIGMSTETNLSDLVRDIKNNSSNFINDNKWVKGKFAWQKGYGAFSISHKDRMKVHDYIMNQENHHAMKSFRDEYVKLIEEAGITKDLKYAFEE